MIPKMVPAARAPALQRRPTKGATHEMPIFSPRRELSCDGKKLHTRQTDDKGDLAVFKFVLTLKCHEISRDLN